MRIYFTKIKEKMKFFKKIFKKIVHVINTFNAFIVLKESFLVIINNNQPMHHRVKTAMKVSFCFTALVSSYFSSLVPDRRVAAAFHVYCSIATGAYILTDGDVRIALSILAASKPTR